MQEQGGKKWPEKEGGMWKTEEKRNEDNGELVKKQPLPVWIKPSSLYSNNKFPALLVWREAFYFHSWTNYPVYIPRDFLSLSFSFCLICLIIFTVVIGDFIETLPGRVKL